MTVEPHVNHSDVARRARIVEILNKSRKVSKKKVEDMVFGSTKKTTSRKGKSAKTSKSKRRRILAADRSEICARASLNHTRVW